jgi:hypothetical protein
MPLIIEARLERGGTRYRAACRGISLFVKEVSFRAL